MGDPGLEPGTSALSERPKQYPSFPVVPPCSNAQLSPLTTSQLTPARSLHCFPRSFQNRPRVPHERGDRVRRRRRGGRIRLGSSSPTRDQAFVRRRSTSSISRGHSANPEPLSTYSPTSADEDGGTVRDLHADGEALPRVGWNPARHVRRYPGVEMEPGERRPRHARAVSLLPQRLRRHKAGRVHRSPQLAVVGVGVLRSPVPVHEHAVELVPADDKARLLVELERLQHARV
jgi:hypothetical protein